jgi:predicted DNA-binding ribbon-helix-helix protein
MHFSKSDVANYLIDNDYFQKIEELAEVRNVNAQVIIEDIYDHLNHNIKVYYRLSKHYMSNHCSSSYVISLASRVLDIFYAKEVEGTARGFPIPGN